MEAECAVRTSPPSLSWLLATGSHFWSDTHLPSPRCRLARSFKKPPEKVSGQVCGSCSEQCRPGPHTRSRDVTGGAAGVGWLLCKNLDVSPASSTEHLQCRPDQGTPTERGRHCSERLPGCACGPGGGGTDTEPSQLPQGPRRLSPAPRAQWPVGADSQCQHSTNRGSQASFPRLQGHGGSFSLPRPTSCSSPLGSGQVRWLRRVLVSAEPHPCLRPPTQEGPAPPLLAGALPAASLDSS